MGIRNPFRFSFDARDFTPANAGPGPGWVGDVGQNDIEEVDVVIAGRQLRLAGARRRLPVRPQRLRPQGGPLGRVRVRPYDERRHVHRSRGAVRPRRRDRDHRRLRLPRQQRPCAAGQYVFGDTSRRLNNAHGRLFATSGAKTGPHRVVELRDDPLDVQLIGFGQDEDNELYAMVFEPGVSGQVLHITR